jgi:hypothetical protein
MEPESSLPCSEDQVNTAHSATRRLLSVLILSLLPLRRVSSCGIPPQRAGNSSKPLDGVELVASTFGRLHLRRTKLLVSTQKQGETGRWYCGRATTPNPKQPHMSDVSVRTQLVAQVNISWNKATVISFRYATSYCTS